MNFIMNSALYIASLAEGSKHVPAKVVAQNAASEVALLCAEQFVVLPGRIKKAALAFTGLSQAESYPLGANGYLCSVEGQQLLHAAKIESSPWRKLAMQLPARVQCAAMAFSEPLALPVAVNKKVKGIGKARLWRTLARTLAAVAPDNAN